MTRWVKGQSGNPGGRPKGITAELSRMIADRTKGGAELVEFALSVWRDESAPMGDRKWAHDWLADRWAGKSPQSIELSGGLQTQSVNVLGMVDLAKLPTEKLLELESILSSATGEPLLLKAPDDE